MKNGEKVRLVDFKDGQIIPWQGVVPLIDGK
jgi:hypothetical protein